MNLSSPMRMAGTALRDFVMPIGLGITAGRTVNQAVNTPMDQLIGGQEELQSMYEASDEMTKRGYAALFQKGAITGGDSIIVRLALEGRIGPNADLSDHSEAGQHAIRTAVKIAEANPQVARNIDYLIAQGNELSALAIDEGIQPEEVAAAKAQGAGYDRVSPVVGTVLGTVAGIKLADVAKELPSLMRRK